jgi:hypothetical protein
MTNLLAAPGALFRDKDLFVHDGTKLRRLRVSWRAQALFAAFIGVLLAFSSFSLVRFLTPQAETPTAQVPAEMARLAAATEQRVNEIEHRQQLLAAMLSGDDKVDPEVLKRIASSSANGVGGPLEPVGGADTTFKQLFNSWKKLDSISQGAIAVPSRNRSRPLLSRPAMASVPTPSAAPPPCMPVSISPAQSARRFMRRLTAR